MPLGTGRHAPAHAAYSSLILFWIAVGLAGCSAYQVGHQTLFRPDIRTVYVPVFESDSIRRHVGEQLTEAVIKEIEMRTPYKVISDPGADSVLNGRIIQERKSVIAENMYDDARNIQAELTVDVRWISRRGEMLLDNSGLPLGISQFTATRHEDFIPEAGQSLGTAHQMAIQRLAREIVGQMEFDW